MRVGVGLSIASPSVLRRGVPPPPGGGGQSTGLYGFTSGSLPSGVTLTRASSATHVNAATGYITTVGNNVARFEDAGSGQKALLIEPATTNHMPWSEDLAQADQIGSNVTITAGEASPDGGTNARRVQLTAATTQNFFQFDTISGLPVNQHLLLSFWIKQHPGATNNRIISRFQDFSPDVDPSGGDDTVFSSLWARYLDSRSNNSDSSGTIAFRNALTSLWGGDGTMDADVFGLQLEGANASGQATSYIKTAGAAATRAADSLNLDVPDGSYRLEILTTEGTHFVNGLVASGGAGLTVDATHLQGRYRVKSISYGPAVTEPPAPAGDAEINGLGVWQVSDQLVLDDFTNPIPATASDNKSGTHTVTDQNLTPITLNGSNWTSR